MKLSVNPSIFPLGDSAITIDLGNHVDDQLNRKTLAIHDWLQAHRLPGVVDIIVAYSSVSVFYDPMIVRSGKKGCPGGVSFCLRQLLQEAWVAVGMETERSGGEETEGSGEVGTEGLGEEETEGSGEEETEGLGEGDAGAGKEDTGMGETGKEVSVGGRAGEVDKVGGGHFFRIPVCYTGEYAPDLEWVAREKGISTEEVIRLHYSTVYHVYMIGFLPGFPYLGRIDARLEVPRKERPVPVLSGGVGIAGVQTGIYPLNSPGGWQIIGRTPTRLFNPADDPPVHLQAGDRVQFYPIGREEFANWGGGSGAGPAGKGAGTGTEISGMGR